MPARRRSTLSRSPIERAQMWDAKVRGDVYATQLSATKPLALPKVASYMATHEHLISVVKSVVGRFGTEASRTQEYMWYAEKLEKIARTYKDKALQVQADSLYLWYVSRGMNDVVLRSIAQALGIRISPIGEIMERVLSPLLLKILAEGSITADGSEQTILEYHGLAMISGYIDLSSMDEDDEVVVRAYTIIERGGEFKLYSSKPFTGRQAEPALYVLPRLSAYGFKVTIQQTKGSHKTFKYLFVKGV